MTTIGEFLQVVKKTQIVEAPKWIENLENAIGGLWNVYFDRELNTGMVRELSLCVAAITMVELIKITDRKTYEIKMQRICAFLQEIHKKAAERGVKEAINHPLTRDEVMAELAKHKIPNIITQFKMDRRTWKEITGNVIISQN